jgi:RND family efflux transporter MFP subunit
VRAASVEHRPIAHPIRVTGLVRSKNEIELSFLVGGEVKWVGVDVGTNVRRGQVLARIDETQVAADAARARASADKARRDLDRVAALQKSGALPEASLDDAKTGDAIAVAQKRSADFALRHGVLVAPDDGVIESRLVDAGEVVGPGQTAFRLSGKARGAVVRAALSDRDVVGLEVGRGAVASIDALGDEVFTAKVSQIAAAASAGSGTFEVELRLDSAPKDVRNGMTAKLEIQRILHPGSLIPVAALTPGEAELASVVAIDNGVARRWSVHVSFFEETEVALEESLPGVTRVATEGAPGLTNGLRVKAVVP